MHKLRRKGNLEGLFKAATYTDLLVDREGRVVDAGASVRVAAIEAITDYEALADAEVPGVVPALEGALSDNAESVRQAAVGGLALVDSDEACGCLIEFLATGDDPAPLIRQEALNALCEAELAGLTERWARAVLELRTLPLDDVNRHEFIALKASDREAEPEQRVFEALGPTLASDDAQPSQTAMSVTVLRWCTPISFQGLKGMLSSPPVPLPLIEIAGLTGDQALLDPLADLLEHADPVVRQRAADALGAMCDTGVVLPLLKATRDRDVRVRRAALTALQALGSAGVTTAMALLAQANREGAVDGLETDLALSGEKWTRTLGRLVARPGLRNLSWRRGRDVKLQAARTQYEALLARNRNPEQGDVSGR